MDREPNAREQFEKYRDDDIKGLTNYAREYGAVKALELAAQKTATLQLVIDRYRTGELRAELRPEPTADDVAKADRFTAGNLARLFFRDNAHYYGTEPMFRYEDEIAAALAAARAPLEAKVKALGEAGRKGIEEACGFCQYAKVPVSERRILCEAAICPWLIIIDALAALVNPPKAEEVESDG